MCAASLTALAEVDVRQEPQGGPIVDRFRCSRQRGFKLGDSFESQERERQTGLIIRRARQEPRCAGEFIALAFRRPPERARSRGRPELRGSPDRA